MNFTLDYQSITGADSPVRAARVPWDSLAFGHDVYELDIGAAPVTRIEHDLVPWLDALRHPPRSLVVAKLEAQRHGELRMLSQRGFVPVESIFRLFLLVENLRLDSPIELLGSLRDARPSDLKRLQEIAAVAFRSDRFHHDPRLDPAGAEERMRNWVANCFAAGEPIWVHHDVDGKILGAISFRQTTAGESLFSLAMTDPAHQATGASITMFHLAFERWRALGHRRAVIDVSSNNCPSLNVALALGFRFERSRITLHWTSAS